MGLKLRAVIFEPGHTNDIFTIKKKDMVENTFVRDGATYLIDADHFQVTTRRPWYYLWLHQEYFATYYYTKAKTKPLPVPNFEGKTPEPEPQKPLNVPAFEGEGIVADMSATEVAAIFNPWFYRIIGAPARDVWDQMHFYVSVGTLLLIGYHVWTMSQGQADMGAMPPADGGVAP